MDEDRLLRRIALGVIRLRFNAGVRWLLGGLVASSALAAVGVLAVRIQVAWLPVAMVAVWSLPILVAVLGLIGFILCRPGSEEVAWRLDRGCGLQEHLTTWIEQRRRPPSTDPVVRRLVELQKQATLCLAGAVRPWRQLPLVLPGWVRAGWLTLLALGCAVLMPEQRPEGDHVSGARSEAAVAVAGGMAAGRRLTRTDLLKTRPRIEILSPAERWKYELGAFGQDVPDVVKADMLRQLEAKVSALPEADLDTDVRRLLLALRKQVRGQEASGAEGGTTVAVNQDPGAGTAPGRVVAGSNALAPQEAVAMARERYPDVAEALHRYYLSN